MFVCHMKKIESVIQNEDSPKIVGSPSYQRSPHVPGEGQLGKDFLCVQYDTKGMDREKGSLARTCFVSNTTQRGWIDGDLMLYAQSTTKGSIRAFNNMYCNHKSNSDSLR